MDIGTKQSVLSRLTRLGKIGNKEKVDELMQVFSRYGDIRKR